MRSSEVDALIKTAWDDNKSAHALRPKLKHSSLRFPPVPLTFLVTSTLSILNRSRFIVWLKKCLTLRSWPGTEPDHNCLSISFRLSTCQSTGNIDVAFYGRCINLEIMLSGRYCNQSQIIEKASGRWRIESITILLFLIYVVNGLLKTSSTSSFMHFTDDTNIFISQNNNNNNNNFRVSNIRVSNRTLIYNVCLKSTLAWPSRHSRHRHLCRFYRSLINR